MKRVFLASTALVLTAGLAAAEVSVSGDGRMGVKSTGGGDAMFSSRMRIKFVASGETDNGLAFGGDFRAHDASGANSGTAGSVYVSGPFGKLAMGSVDSAANTAVGQPGGIGYTGIEAANISYIGVGEGGMKPAALWSYDMGDLSLYASTANPNGMDDRALSGALSYSIGDVSAGVGVERMGDAQHLSAGVSAALGGASVKLVFGSHDDGVAGTDNRDQYGASATFVTGAATFMAYTGNNLSDEDHFGIGIAYDLGGGAALKGGFVDGDSAEYMDGPTFDLGITMGF